VFGVSRERIRQIEFKALGKLRRNEETRVLIETLARGKAMNECNDDKSQ